MSGAHRGWSGSVMGVVGGMHITAPYIYLGIPVQIQTLMSAIIGPCSPNRFKCSSRPRRGDKCDTIAPNEMHAYGFRRIAHRLSPGTHRRSTHAKGPDFYAAQSTKEANANRTIHSSQVKRAASPAAYSPLPCLTISLPHFCALYLIP